MKYYLYISDSIVDMLFPQIPQDIKKKVATEYKIDLKVFSAARKVETETPDDRIARLDTVCDFIEQYADVQSADGTGEYVKDTLLMKWGKLAGGPSVYFTGTTPSGTVVGLGGSAHHLIGVKTPPTLDYTFSSALPAIEHNLTEFFGSRIDSEGSADDADLLDSAFWAQSRMKGREETLTFLAKRLCFGQALGPRHKPCEVIIGTPLYVELAD